MNAVSWRVIIYVLLFVEASKCLTELNLFTVPFPIDKKFFSKKALVTHLKTLREKKFKCSLCDKLFKQAGELKIHLRSHT